MSIIGKVFNKFRSAYWKAVSKKRKELFKCGSVETYQFMDEVFCDKKTTFDHLVSSYSGNIKSYWDSQKSYSLKDFFPKTYAETRSLLFEHFLSLYSEKPCLMDIGCASGEWTLLLAPMCNAIDGYEYSQALVDSANANSADVENVQFYQSDAKNMSLSKTYDGALILAMLMYIDDPDDICKILRNVYEHLTPGAYLCTRDTLNNEERDVIYLFNKNNGYNAVYWSKEIYYEQFRKAGFVMKEELLLGEVKTRRMDFLHYGNIWQKPFE